jgi:hypothetical protein
MAVNPSLKRANPCALGGMEAAVPKALGDECTAFVEAQNQHGS